MLSQLFNLKVMCLNCLSFFIGLFIVGILLYLLVKAHNAFSEENIPFNSSQVVIERLVKPIF